MLVKRLPQRPSLAFRKQTFRPPERKGKHRRTQLNAASGTQLASITRLALVLAFIAQCVTPWLITGHCLAVEATHLQQQNLSLFRDAIVRRADPVLALESPHDHLVAQACWNDFANATHSIVRRVQNDYPFTPPQNSTKPLGNHYITGLHLVISNAFLAATNVALNCLLSIITWSISRFALMFPVTLGRMRAMQNVPRALISRDGFHLVYLLLQLTLKVIMCPYQLLLIGIARCITSTHSVLTHLVHTLWKITK